MWQAFKIEKQKQNTCEVYVYTINWEKKTLAFGVFCVCVCEKLVVFFLCDNCFVCGNKMIGGEVVLWYELFSLEKVSNQYWNYN